MTTPLKTLDGKVVVLAVTGSIAAVETVRLAHALRRRGAEVRAVMSPAACRIIAPDALTYATGQEAITEITGIVEHVVYCGEGGKGDLLLIAPCTANTLGKIAHAIDDTTVSTFATTALGRGMPVVIAPAMHESMYRHPGVAANIERLRELGIDVIDPRIEEGKAKVAEIEEIVLHTERALMGHGLAGKKVLITSGACAEPLDDVRVLTTRSGGEMGRALALHAYRMGADVTVVHNNRFPCVTNVHASTASDMRSEVERILMEPVNIYISAAAISDFAPERMEGKIRSGRAVLVHLQPLPKLLDLVLEKCRPETVVAFKLGWDEEEGARDLLRQGADMVVINAPPVMGAPSLHTGSFTLITRDGTQKINGNKEEVAAAICDALQ